MLTTAILILIALRADLCTGQVTVPKEPNVLTPPYFNIATGKKIESTATCGEDSRHVFCKLTGGPNEYEYNANLYQGQFCDLCDGSDPNKAHPIKYAIDGTEKWWQSPPLSQGSEFNRINVTIHLGQVFHVAYVIIKFANSPRAGTWVLERSSDHGATFQPWQYFANSDSDCHNLFGIDAFEDIIRDDSVICTSEYSDVVPLESGEVIVSIVNRRPGAKNFSHSPILQEWSKATNIRIRLLRTKTLLGHLMAVQRQDPTVTRRYFYSIKDISIGGRCVCNGHADTCVPDPKDKYKLKCQCRHNTCGDSCEYCCPGFVQKEWRAAVPESSNECEPCNCHGHSNECEYNEQVSIRRQSLDLAGSYVGGGVCLNCQHNTSGINCEICKDGYYRPANIDPRDPNGCRACDCDSAFTVGTCEPVTGRCYCKPKYAGDRCDRCAPGYHMFPECEPCPCYYNATRNGQCLPGGDGYCPCKYNFAGKYCSECAIGFYNFPECVPCTCHGQGAVSNDCDPYSGQCSCDEGFGGLYCDECSPGYYNYPVCQSCSCYSAFTTDQVCDPQTGECFCTELVTGESCNECLPGYYDFPKCKECECASPGSANSFCDPESGRCQCKPNFQGIKCEECAPEYYDYPNCVPCDCDVQGSQRTTCDQISGDCTCFSYITGRRCDHCAPDYFNFPRCEDCKCDPRGIKSIVPGICLAFTTGQCDCKENIVGKYCNMCKPLHYNLTLGCISCNCFLQGTLDGVAACDTEDGQCWCKSYTLSQKCSQCKDGFFGLEEKNYLGCSGCQCDTGGALSDDCDSIDGQCQCRNGVSGRQCNTVNAGYFYPTLLQHKFEIEEGRTEENKIFRFGFDENEFPGFSMKGYGEFSVVQPIAILDVTITRNSLYKVLIHYLKPHPTTLSSTLSFVPKLPRTTEIEEASGNKTESECPNCSEQSFQVVFEPSATPALMKVKDVFVLNRGKWNVVIEGEPGLLIDYLVLLPSEYYEPGILQAKVTSPCKPVLIPTGKECLMYTHSDISDSPSVDFTSVTDSLQHDAPTTAHPMMVVLDGSSVDDDFKTVSVTVRPPSAGKYVLVLIYASLEDRIQTVEATVTDGGDKTFSNVKFNTYSCGYSFLCRQVALTPLSDVMVFDIDIPSIHVDLSADAGEKLFISGIHAIAYEQWNMEMVEPKTLCITQEGPEFVECIDWAYPIPATSQKFDVSPDDDDEHEQPPGTTNVDAKHLDGTNKTIQIQMDLQPGRYVFLLHYFNPNHLSFSPSVVISGGPTYEGSGNITHCPNVNGCRGVITSNIGAVVLDIKSPTQTLTLTVPEGKSFWLDYVLAIPEYTYRADHLELMPTDHSRKFFDECYGVASESIIDSSQNPSEFCRSTIFSLTTDFNDGAFACNCDSEGTVGGTDDCEDFGGQCPCKPNVIGRQCDRCMVGFYGFPDCILCDCDGGLCDEINGNCICPPNTISPQCNECMPFTHSFHPLAGCEFCDCHPEGVENADDLGCSKKDGQCRCKENVEGLRCDKCKPGFFGFPNCQPCICSEAGRLSEGCNATTGQCLCKENVEGQQCDRCKRGTFYLNANNPLGCTKCFCFGVSAECTTTPYPLKEIYQMDGWRLLNLRTDTPEVVFDGNEVMVDIAENGGALNPSRANLYWAAPKDYLGDLIGSYGGELHYYTESKRVRGSGSRTGGFVISTGEQPAPLSAPAPSVIMMGNGLVIGWVNREYSNESSPVALTLTEKNFINHNTGKPVKREEMMMVLGSLSSLRIHASDDPEAVIVGISGVSLTTTDYSAAIGTGPTIKSVEQCTCPEGYTGQSCQLCASMYYRNQDLGPYLGYCSQCECFGHCESCDNHGQIKSSCLHNTDGEHCERCKDGYIGDATSRDPDACQPCPCPFPLEDGNFAESCAKKGDGSGDIICYCQEGYTGEKCDQCSLGYFGNPSIIGHKCNPCNCHGNLDSNLVMETCNPVTGECSDCQYNTGGKYCERCADGFYGDAKVARNCTACSCLSCGTLQCNHIDGKCACKPHVIGRLCDKCEPGFYNLDSCSGCINCGCDIGSLGDICNEYTGACECAPNVVGLKCDKCKPGHWDYSEMGCKPCNCRNNGACNPVNGACKCPPGITGPQCDQCKLPRHVLPPGGLQCKSCGSCTHDLLDTIEPLTNKVQESSTELSRVSVGVAAANKLATYESRMQNDRDDLEELQRHINGIVGDTEKIVSGTVIPSLNGIGLGSGDEGSGWLLLNEEFPQETFASVQDALAKTDDAVTKMCNRTEVLLEKAEIIASRMMKLQKNVNATDHEVDEFLFDAKDLLDKLEEESSGDTDEYLQKLKNAEMILERIKQRDFNSLENVSDDEMALAQDLLDAVSENFTIPVGDLEKRVEKVKQDLADKMTKMKELRNLLNEAIQNVTEVATINAVNSKALTKAQEEVNKINTEYEEIKQILDDARNMLHRPDDPYPVLDTDALDAAVADLQLMYDSYVNGLEGKEELVNRSMEKAERLRSDADALSRLVEETKNDPRNLRAVEAANRYRTIVNTMEEAKQAADQADLDATEARDDVDEKNLGEAAKTAHDDARNLLSEVETLRKEGVEELKEDLENAEDSSSVVKELAIQLSGEIDQVKRRIGNLDQGDIDSSVQKTKENAAGANKLSDEVQRYVDDLQKQINSSIDPNIPIEEELRAVDESFSNLENQVDEAAILMQNLKTRAAEFERLPDELGLMPKTDEIKKLIALSRSRADSVKLAMRFKRLDNIQIQNPQYVQIHVPPSVYNVEDNLRIELYAKVNQADNSLLYLGDSSSNDGDYVALETVAGKVRYYYKVGEGVGELESDISINDKQWHHIVIERNGNQAKLIVEYEKEAGRGDLSGVIGADTKTGSTDHEDVKSNFPQLQTPFIVGGLPSIVRPDKIQNEQLDGCISDVQLNNEGIGMWNFILYSGPQPGQNCPTRPTSQISRLWRFRGYDSYLRVGSEKLQEQNFYVSLDDVSFVFRFKFFTVQSDSLLFFIGQSIDNFFALELRGGKFVLTCNFGFAGGVEQRVLQNYRDVTTIAQPLIIKAGVVQFGRSDVKMVVLSINSDLNLNITFTDWNPNIVGDAWVGGIYHTDIKQEFRQYVTNIDTHFRGCLSDLAFHIRDTFNIYDSKERIGVNPGCQRDAITNIQVDGDDFISIASGVPNLDKLSGLVTVIAGNSSGESLGRTILSAEETKVPPTLEPFVSETVTPNIFDDNKEEEDARLIREHDDPMKPKLNITIGSGINSGAFIPGALTKPTSKGGRKNTGELTWNENNVEPSHNSPFDPVLDKNSWGDDSTEEKTIIVGGVEETNPKFDVGPRMTSESDDNFAKEEVGEIIEQPELSLKENALVGRKEEEHSNVDEQASSSSILPAVLVIICVVVGVVLFGAVVSAVMKGSLLSGSNGASPPITASMEQSPMNYVAQHPAQIDW